MAKAAAFGSKIAQQRLQTGSYADIAYVGDLNGPEISVEPIDVTTHDSANAFTEYLAGLADAGEVSFDLVFDSASSAHSVLYSDVAARLMHNWQIKLPGFVNTGAGGYFAFAGFLSKIGIVLPVKDKFMASVTIKISGKPDYFLFD